MLNAKSVMPHCGWPPATEYQKLGSESRVHCGAGLGVHRARARVELRHPELRVGGRRKRAQTSDRCRGDQRAAHPEQHPHSFPSCRAPALRPALLPKKREVRTPACVRGCDQDGGAGSCASLASASSRVVATRRDASTCVISTRAAAGLPSGRDDRQATTLPAEALVGLDDHAERAGVDERDRREVEDDVGGSGARADLLVELLAERARRLEVELSREDGHRRTLLHRWLLHAQDRPSASLHDSETFALRVKTVAAAGHLLHRWTQRHIGEADSKTPQRGNPAPHAGLSSAAKEKVSQVAGPGQERPPKHLGRPWQQHWRWVTVFIVRRMRHQASRRGPLHRPVR